MSEPREIKVKLTADVSQYLDAMKAAKKATGKALRHHSWLNAAWGYHVALWIGLIGGLTAGFGVSAIIGLVR